MSVVILGMEMPTTCVDCELYHNGGEYGGYGSCEAHWVIFGKEDDWVYETRPNWCPLRPLPEKHRRLIDADAVVDKMWRLQATYQMMDDTQTADKIIHGIYLARQTINECPTIVEAEGD